MTHINENLFIWWILTNAEIILFSFFKQNVAYAFINIYIYMYVYSLKTNLLSIQNIIKINSTKEKPRGIRALYPVMHTRKTWMCNFEIRSLRSYTGCTGSTETSHVKQGCYVSRKWHTGSTGKYSDCWVCVRRCSV